MKERLIYIAKMYLYWLLFMLVQKPVFMLANWHWLGGASVSEFMQVLWHALPLDASVAAYITMVCGLMTIIGTWIPSRGEQVLQMAWTEIALGLCLLTFIGDLAVFPSWGFHLDKTVFVYLKDPKMVIACIATRQWVVLPVALAGLWLFWWMMYVSLIGTRYTELTTQLGERSIGRKIGESAVLLLVTALLFLPARGSVSTSTMNTGRVYFSDRQQLNISAVNPLFNILESVGENTFDAARYHYMPDEEATERVEALMHSANGKGAAKSLLKTNRPRIVLLILESFSTNALEAMPCVSRLKKEGIDFVNAYASSYRTDRGVVATMSAFPGQPTSSLMTVPIKSQQLPGVGKSLLSEGYRLKFWYGGDEDFTNMRSYLVSSGFQERVSDKSFSHDERRSKWGAHDHLLLSRLGDELLSRDTLGEALQTLDVVLTLSSHEPFEVPASERFEHPYLNSIAYTDSCIGALVDRLRTSANWDSTLIVLVADHGYPYPGDVQNFEPSRYQIPMLIAGGAVRKPRKVKQVCSQIDLVPTLLSQMGVDISAYRFGKDILSPATKPYAFYSFNDGFGLITPTDTVVIDARADRILIGEEGTTEQQARAYIQVVMETADQL